MILVAHLRPDERGEGGGVRVVTPGHEILTGRSEPVYV